MKLDIAPCLSPVWARGGHRQTVLAHLLASPTPLLEGRLVKIPLVDSDVLVGRFYAGTTSSLLLLFHGLGGSTESGYIRRSVQVGLGRGFSVLAVNHRSCGEGKDLARQPYHSGRGEDISEVVAYARKNFSPTKLFAVGFSLGGNALLTLISGLRGQHLPDAAIVVNAPIDLATASQMLKKGLNRLYDLNFVQGCRASIYQMRDQGLIPFDQKIPRFSHLHDIDKIYTAPYGKFKSAEHYYETCSTYLHLHKIEIPTWLFMSKDDPFIPWQPYEAARKNPHICLHLEETGGHVGYLSQGKYPWSYRRWLDEAFGQVLDRI